MVSMYLTRTFPFAFLSAARRWPIGAARARPFTIATVASGARMLAPRWLALTLEEQDAGRKQTWPTSMTFLGPVLRAGLTWLGKGRLPQINGTLNLPGLSAPVEVIRDRWGVPHIYAANAHDLFFAQGFVHAQDRLWQMELNRRTATGRLSELFGALALDTDRAVRTFGFHRLGQADWANADAEIREAITGLHRRRQRFIWPTRRPRCRSSSRCWAIAPSRGSRKTAWPFARVMIWQLSHAWYGEIVRAQLIEAVGEEHAAELEIHYPDLNPHHPAGGHRVQPARRGWHAARRARPVPEPRPGQQCVGHLRQQDDDRQAVPLQRHAPAADAAFAVVPGSPRGRAVQRHRRLAARHAAGDGRPQRAHRLGHDAGLHRLRRPVRRAVRSADRAAIASASEWLEAEVIRRRRFASRAGEPHVEQVSSRSTGRSSRTWSAIPSSAWRSTPWRCARVRPCGAGCCSNEAGNWDEFVDAMRLIEAPQLNVAYADVDGNIGYWVTGKVPVRAKGQGMVPAPGWTGEYEWVGEVPFEEMPHALNPEQGYVVTCNNRIIPDDYPHFLGTVWMNGYRARRITDVSGEQGQAVAR